MRRCCSWILPVGVVVVVVLGVSRAPVTALVAPQPRLHARSSSCLSATIAVIGASGLTAQECVYQALQNGDTVVGLTRYVLVRF
jgi:hypothetical protein